MPAPWHALLKPLALGALTLALALLALVWNGAPPAVRAALAQGLGQAGLTCTVCPAGGGCDYTTIQAAVDDPGCTEIKVAQGVYTGVQGRRAPSGYAYPYPLPWDRLITQVVYISRTVALRGSYTTTNWATPDPVAQPTTLDAGGLGRVMVVAGDISPTIEGLNLTNGKAIRLGGDPSATSGGGVYILSATATLSASRVFSNLSDYGGGLYLAFSPATLISNSVTANSANYGGGLYLQSSNATLSANNVTGNTANHSGGGLYLQSSNATLTANAVTGNIAAISNFSVGFGGGLYLHHSAATLSANSVASNTAHLYGGGLYLDSSAATLNANSVTANTALQGGGLFMGDSPAWLSANSVTSNTANTAGGLFVFYSNATFTNTVVASNRGRDRGSGLFISGGSYVPPSETRLLHTTIAGNWGGDGSGLYALGAGTVWLTNTILASQTLGITVAAGSTATMNSTLWYSNIANWSGAGTLAHSGDITGDPAFADPAHGDYHIGPTSAAIDGGVDAGVTTDKDGRPRDAQPDLGTYEFQGTATDSDLYLPIIVKSAR
jgi:parallel beta-helix repeat protein